MPRGKDTRGVGEVGWALGLGGNRDRAHHAPLGVAHGYGWNVEVSAADGQSRGDIAAIERLPAGRDDLGSVREEIEYAPSHRLAGLASDLGEQPALGEHDDAFLVDRGHDRLHVRHDRVQPFLRREQVRREHVLLGLEGFAFLRESLPHAPEFGGLGVESSDPPVQVAHRAREGGGATPNQVLQALTNRRAQVR